MDICIFLYFYLYSYHKIWGELLIRLRCYIGMEKFLVQTPGRCLAGQRPRSSVAFRWKKKWNPVVIILGSGDCPLDSVVYPLPNPLPRKKPKVKKLGSPPNFISTLTTRAQNYNCLQNFNIIMLMKIETKSLNFFKW